MIPATGPAHDCRQRRSLSGALPVCLLLALVISPLASAAERVGDATYRYDFGQYTRTAAELERQFQLLIESAAGEERFTLYWTLNHLTGAWGQIDYLQSLLSRATAAPTYAEEQATRAALRELAEFVNWEIGATVADLEQNVPDANRPEQRQTADLLRTLLLAVRTTVARLLVDE